MSMKTRVNKLEQALKEEYQIKIPVSEKLLFFWPADTPEAREAKIKDLHDKLRIKYGDTVSREEIIIFQVVYDEEKII